MLLDKRLINIPEVYQFVAERHAGQVYAGLPFQYHLDCVVTQMMRFDFTDDVNLAAALLHDVIEDTATTREEVRERFGGAVEARVWACTGIGPNRKARNADIYAKLAAYPPACVIKAADRLANHAASKREPGTSSPNFAMIKMYLSERVEFEVAVRGHIPPSMWEALKNDYDAFEIILSRRA